MNEQLGTLLPIALILILLPDVCQPSENQHGLLANSWVLPDSWATVGSVFQYQIPRLESEGNTTQYYVTEAGSERLPTWLHFQSSTNILQGVPLVQDEGFMYISVTAHTQPSKELPHETITDIFSIDVRLHNAHHDQWSGSLSYNQAVPVSRTKSGKPDAEFIQRTKCRPEQATYTASLVLNIKLETFRGGERVTVVQNLADFVAKNLYDVRLSARRSSTVSRLLDSDVLAAGPGNMNVTEMYPNKISHGVELTWPLACGGFPKLEDFVQVISHNIEVGTVSDVIGFKVIGWYVTREQPLIRPYKISVDRRKRQAPGNLATPIPTPIMTSAPPTAFVSTTVLEATSSQEIPARTSMISLTMHTSILPVSPSSFAPVMASSSEFPYPTTSIPIFTPQTSSMITETMQFSPTLPGSDFPLISTSLAFPVSTSLHFPFTAIPSLTSSEQPVTSFTVSSIETQAPSLQSTPQRLVSTILPSSSIEITRTSSFRSEETPYVTTTMDGSFPTILPSVSRTEILSAVSSLIPSAAVTSLIPSATSFMQSESTQSILLPSSVVSTTMPLPSSRQFSTPDESFTIPTSLYLSMSQSTPVTPVAETASVTVLIPSSSGITSITEASLLLPSPSTVVISSLSHDRPSTVIVEPSPSDISLVIPTTGIIPSLDISTTLMISPGVTRTDLFPSPTPRSSERMIETPVLSTTMVVPQSIIPSSDLSTSVMLSSDLSRTEIITNPSLTERMTLITETPALSTTMGIPLTTLISATSDQSTSLLPVPSSYSFLMSSILPTNIPTPILTSSLVIASMLSSSKLDISDLLSVPYTASQVSLSASSTMSASASTSAVFPPTSSMLSVTSPVFTTAFVPDTSALLPTSPSLSPETSMFRTTSVLPESSVLQRSTSAAESSVLLPRTSAVGSELTVPLQSTTATFSMSTAQGSITATKLASSILVEPTISSMFTAPIASSVPTSFQPSMPASMLPTLLSSIPLESSTSSFLPRLTQTITPSLPPSSAYYSEPLLTPSTPVLDTSVVMGSTSLFSTSSHEFSSPPTSTIVPSTPVPVQPSSSVPVSESQSQTPETTMTIMPTPSFSRMESTDRITLFPSASPVASSRFLVSSSPVIMTSESPIPTRFATESLIPTHTPTDSLTVSLSSFTGFISTEPPIAPTSTTISITISPTPTSSRPIIASTSMVQSIAPSPVLSSVTVPIIPTSSITPSDTVIPPVSSSIGTSLPETSPSLSAGLIISSTSTLETSVIPTLTSAVPSASFTSVAPTMTPVTTSSAQPVSSSAISSLMPSPSFPVSSSVAVLPTLSPSPTQSLPASTSVVASESFRPSPTPVQPTSSLVMSSSLVPDITTPEPINQPPILLNPVDIVTANLGEFLHQSIPPDTFYDPEEGYTPNLALSLRDKDHAPVTPDSWLQLDADSQVLYGVPLNATVTNYDLEYYLTASDSEGLTTYDAMVVVIIPSTDIYNHVFSVEIDKSYSDFIADGNNIVELGTRIATFYDDVNASALYVDSLVEGSVIMGYSNTSLDVDLCDIAAINALFDRISFPNGTARVDFEAYMMPDFPVLFITKELQGVCIEPIITTPAGNVTALPVTDKNLVVIILVPALIIVLLLLLLCCFACCWYKRSRAGEEFLLQEEKPTYAKNRKPIFLNDELDGLEPNKPSRPVVLPDDISPFRATPKPSTPLEEKRPAPPTYRLPDYAKPSYSNPYYDHHSPDYDRPDYRNPNSPKRDILLVDMSLPNTRLPPPRYTPEPEFMLPPPSRAQRSPIPAMYSPPPVEVHRPPPRYTLPPPYDDEEVGFFPTSHV